MRRLRDARQDEAADAQIARDVQRMRNAVEWIRRAVTAHDAGDYVKAARLHEQSKLEWPHPGIYAPLVVRVVPQSGT